MLWPCFKHFPLLATGLASEGVLSGSHMCTRRLKMALLASSPGSNINEEGSDLIGDADTGKPELSGGGGG